ncbi:putative hydroxyproline-rich glycoprotein dz-hrgp protein [Daldinia childiae]|uniref:putative hydroxyproline-rich glycoprotein dz-hrgp protein n=1 Tax=Daldinia childiae TaxID=326645 RepID=UPI00144806B1|nr:putative hydroxyproline-rich glycoprotein dz-hrgp protein [Daldinia childiae]KAF3070568.1 putative hydroxyproline-rich glycoprotein dz-hrgp protein [Daldinia childiae]
MAEQLSAYDKINHPNIHTRNWEAQSVRIVESKYPANAEAADGYRIAKPHQEQSTSSSSNSITSSSIESASTTSTSAIRTPSSLKNTEIGDTSRPGVRFSDRGPPRTSTGHPTIYRRSSIGAGTGVEWGTLFDDNGYATTRNNQFLRGLAKYIIDDLAPSSSNLVITPEKLCALYSRYRLSPEIYPFIEILNSRARDAHDRLADFFTDLDCQYHLVQPDFYSRPRIPALTPAGFAQYFTTCILAHPDEEFRRLDKIVADVQLVSDTPVDGEPERLPRQLFRSQFPVRHDPKSKKILTAAIDDLIYDLRLLEPSSPRSPLAIMPPPPPSSSNKDRSIVPVIRRYVIPEEYTRRDEYKLAASSEAGQPCGRYQQSMNDEKSGRALMGNRDRETYYGRERSHYSKESSGYRPIPSGDAGSIVLYSPKSTYQRARSPPPRGYRASAPDVSNASTSYFRPAGYLPQPPLTIAERREYAMNPVNPSAAAEDGAREEIRRRESSGGRLETEPLLIEAAAQESDNKAAALTP